MQNKKLTIAAAVLLAFGGLIAPLNAQTKPRKKSKKTPIVKRTPPVIVSRSGQYVDGNQIILSPTQENQNPPPVENNQADTTAEEAELRVKIKELNARLKLLEKPKPNDYDEKQKRLLMNLDILSRAEQRADALRKQLFEMIEKQSTIQTRIDQIQYESRPETINRSVAFAGSLRPEDLRELREKSLAAEQKNLESLLTQIQTNRASLEENVRQADFLVEKVRLKLNKEIDDALTDDEVK